ncbi:MerR family transcriptional regulator [Fructilactobacillus florum]|uniref:HTH merR-type domain-containing protein n=1 Tax=Fructilactobacillus florum DSM 22689 = JCM 16035 TaxID=1423745 RepID=A0A0R2CE42_9LACO|nr:MerR family transcriptional regulator [Fructilactobacillus florum]KRM89799.1 hypothetical protein FC87_GL000334 [Fructilactobacillus florum DSM 22689 = JCM 16035]
MKISEVAQKYRLTAVTLRYYERAGLIPPVERVGGKRNYRETDLQWIAFIKCMRQVRIPVKTLAEYTKLFMAGCQTKPLRRKILSDELARLTCQKQDLQATINQLQQKLSAYDRGEID